MLFHLEQMLLFIQVNDYIVKEAHLLHQIELREKEHLKFLQLS